MPDPAQDTFFIGELARRTGVSRDTIRYYESSGVLPPAERTRSGYRRYGREDVERIFFVGQAQTLGLSLEEIAEILEIVDDGGSPCQRVRGQLSSRLQETRDRIQGLMALERRLVGALALDGDSPRQKGRCRIIESAGRESEAGSPAA